MIRALALWLFVMSCLGDLILVFLKCFDILDWSWGIIIALPFAITIAGTLCFALIYLIIKIFVYISLLFIKW